MESMMNSDGCRVGLEEKLEGWGEAFARAAGAHLQREGDLRPKNPWISDRTLVFLERRYAARKHGNVEAERSLNKHVKASVKQDRSSWLHQMLADGNWRAMKKFKKFRLPQMQKLKRPSGEVVADHERVEVFADHLEHTQ